MESSWCLPIFRRITARSTRQVAFAGLGVGPIPYLEQRPSRSRAGGHYSHLENVLLNIGCATTTQDEGKQKGIKPTNAGMLLFGYDPQQFVLQAEVMCILYKDNLGVRRYADRRILHGTITQQIDQAEAFFKQYVPVAGYMEGFHRRDEPDYPLDALREAVVNAVVHRDYSLQGEIVRIFYYLDHIEIHNPGLLLPGVQLEELQQGKVGSKLRNTSGCKQKYRYAYGTPGKVGRWYRVLHYETVS